MWWMNMLKRQAKKNQGFTLIEMLLVLAVMATIFVMLLGYVNQRAEEIRRDRVTIQLQQILNAGLAFYVNNGYWPVNTAKDCSLPASPGDLSILVAGGYLASAIKNPFNQGFTLSCNATTGNFTVTTQLPTSAEAQIVAGRLPIAQVPAGTTQVATTVNIPGQNLNNARAVNFAGVYHTGACVPAPKCPLGMSPQIIVVPTSISGVNDPGSSSVYPISSFTAYAYGGANGTATPNSAPSNGGPANCYTPQNGQDCTGISPYDAAGSPSYWRVCLNIVTEKGQVTGSGGNEWGQYVSVAAFTRCTVLDGSGNMQEPSGTYFNTWISR
jgi:prepilin-type N-terminal cleavage/methylation domain-containing protein